MPSNSLSAQAGAGPPPSPGSAAPEGEANTPQQPGPPKRGTLITAATGLLTPPLAGLTTTALGASMPVVALVIALSLIPAIPMLVCAYVWSRGALKAIRAAAKGEPNKSKDINSALADALRVLPPTLGGGTAHHPSRDASPNKGKS
jgi:hypothetical protein